MILKNKSFFAMALLLISLQACDNKRVFDEYAKTDGAWSANDTIIFSFEQKDTLGLYNLFFNVRNNNNYPFNNIFLISKMETPFGKVEVDTLEYQMALPDGTLLGNGFSDLKESKLWYQQNYIFRKKGTYTLKIVQALRENGTVAPLPELKGITEVGFRIEKAK